LLPLKLFDLVRVVAQCPPLSFIALADLADADPVLAFRRDVKFLGCPFDRGLFIRRIYLAQVFTTCRSGNAL
jgi:hypothetical protein